MSFNKRFISKEMILSNMSNLDSLLDADMLVMDMWSTHFVENLNRSERISRNKIIKDTVFNSSVISCTTHHLYKEINSMSECLISLKTNPQWLDIMLVHDRLGVKTDGSGNFKDGVEKCIQRIIEHFDKPTRDDKIEEILK